jgi:hypothetical protein
MNRFGADEWTANWDQPGNTTQVNMVDPTTGTVSPVPYYLAADVPPPGLPAHGDYTPSVGMVDVYGQPVAQPGPPAPSSGGFDWSGLFTGVVRGLTGNAGAPRQQPIQQAAAPSMLPWIIGGVAAVAVVGLLLMKSSKGSMAGYRKRRSRR